MVVAAVAVALPLTATRAINYVDVPVAGPPAAPVVPAVAAVPAPVAPLAPVAPVRRSRQWRPCPGRAGPTRPIAPWVDAGTIIINGRRHWRELTPAEKAEIRRSVAQAQGGAGPHPHRSRGNPARGPRSDGRGEDRPGRASPRPGRGARRNRRAMREIDCPCGRNPPVRPKSGTDQGDHPRIAEERRKYRRRGDHAQGAGINRSRPDRSQRRGGRGAVREAEAELDRLGERSTGTTDRLEAAQGVAIPWRFASRGVRAGRLPGAPQIVDGQLSKLTEQARFGWHQPADLPPPRPWSRRDHRLDRPQGQSATFGCGLLRSGTDYAVFCSYHQCRCARSERTAQVRCLVKARSSLITTAAAIVADCSARKFETSVEIEKNGQKRLTKLKLCAARRGSDRAGADAGRCKGENRRASRHFRREQRREIAAQNSTQKLPRNQSGGRTNDPCRP